MVASARRSSGKGRTAFAMSSADCAVATEWPIIRAIRRDAPARALKALHFFFHIYSGIYRSGRQAGLPTPRRMSTIQRNVAQRVGRLIGINGDLFRRLHDLERKRHIGGARHAGLITIGFGRDPRWHDARSCPFFFAAATGPGRGSRRPPPHSDPVALPSCPQ